MALGSKTIDPDAAVDERIADAIRSRLEDGRLPCTAARAVADMLGVAPSEVGRTADQLRIHLTRCQLGLYGHPGHAKGWEAAGVAARPIPDGLEDTLLAARNERGEIGCERLWREAERFSVEPIQVAYVADRLGITIRECLLGAF
jgi:hypothetical protein